MHLDSSLQTLANLDLHENSIGGEGSQYLANMLRVNQVNFLQSKTSHMHENLLIKTLTILDLEKNQIDDVGACHLANALQYNTVSSRNLSPLACYTIFCLTVNQFVESSIE